MGKKSTPSDWLGGTGEFVAVDKQEQEQERLERRNHCCNKSGQGMFPKRIE